MKIYKSTDKGDLYILNETKERLEKKSTYTDDSFYQSRLDNKTSMEKMINSLIERTGLKEYINEINGVVSEENKKVAQEQEDKINYTSLIQLPEVKEAIDKAIQRKQYTSYIDLLNALQFVVRNDNDIPDSMKNVHSDKELVNYVKGYFVTPKDTEVKYDLSCLDQQPDTDPSKEAPFKTLNPQN